MRFLTLLRDEDMLFKCSKCQKMNPGLTSHCWHCGQEFFFHVRPHDGTTERPALCPICYSDDIIPINYWPLCKEMRQDWLAGKIEVVGSVMDVKDAANPPQWSCKKCGNRWK